MSFFQVIKRYIPIYPSDYNWIERYSPKNKDTFKKPCLDHYVNCGSTLWNKNIKKALSKKEAKWNGL